MSEAKRFVLYVPQNQQDFTGSIQKLIREVEGKRGIRCQMKIFKENSEDEEELRYKILMPLAILNQVGFRKTKRTKTLYPHLVVYRGEKPVTFFPQHRPTIWVEIEDYLQSILDGKQLPEFPVKERLFIEERQKSRVI